MAFTETGRIYTWKRTGYGNTSVFDREGDLRFRCGDLDLDLDLDLDFSLADIYEDVALTQPE